MAKQTHNPQKDILKLARAVLHFTKMPAEGNGRWASDAEYLAEYVAPLAGRIKERYKSQWRRVPAGAAKK